MEPTRRERRDARQRRIEAVALELFSVHGFDAVTVEQVCAAAEVAPATFYRYFGTKEAVVFAYRGAFDAALEVALDAAGGEPVPQQLRRILVSFAERIDGMREEIRSRDAVVPGNTALMRGTLEVQRSVETRLVEGLARLRGEPGPGDATVVEAGIGLVTLRLGLRTWLEGRHESLPAAVRSALDVALTLAERVDAAR